MSFDPHKNLSYSTVATAPSPASSGTSLVVQASDGTKFPAASFNATVWPSGSQPTTSNAEIVRVTVVSTDTFTITRAQEGTSARTIVVGDQIAATITAKTLTDVEGSTNPSVVVVAAPTGVGATDNANIAAAITACPTGGIVQFQAGTYALGTSGVTVAKTLTLRGTGGADVLWANFGTLLTLDSATAVGIQISSHGVRLENFAIQNTHVTAPTAGAGIRTVTGGGNSMHYGPNLSVRGFYYDVDHQAGSNWSMDPSFYACDFVYAGLRIQNVDSVDGGDMKVSGDFIAGPTNNGTAAIQWLSGGGFRGYGIKINAFTGKTCAIGVDMELQDGVSTVDFQLIGCSIENTNWGFLCEHAGPSNTGTFENIVIQGCQFDVVGLSPTMVIAVSPAVSSKVSRANIGGNIIVGKSGQSGIYFQHLDNSTHGPNVFAVVGTSYTDGGSNTNITSVGAG